jgi:hypothetical protein
LRARNLAIEKTSLIGKITSNLRLEEVQILRFSLHVTLELGLFLRKERFAEAPDGLFL